MRLGLRGPLFLVQREVLPRKLHYILWFFCEHRRHEVVHDRLQLGVAGDVIFVGRLQLGLRGAGRAAAGGQGEAQYRYACMRGPTLRSCSLLISSKVSFAAASSAIPLFTHYTTAKQQQCFTAVINRETVCGTVLLLCVCVPLGCCVRVLRQAFQYLHVIPAPLPLPAAAH